MKNIKSFYLIAFIIIIYVFVNIKCEIKSAKGNKKSNNRPKRELDFLSNLFERNKSKSNENPYELSKTNENNYFNGINPEIPFKPKLSNKFPNGQDKIENEIPEPID
ncbi:hypothetical protein Mgra_00004657 [Meloidogyne graminicola]|uniref:Uncharacterized protein n=1 Tax=Meloidogyne graminicola TaxID=189291 RepID=A0A8S9ZSC0_9BILA|nr:hypothetical protein Mgra_00004657 [Meloidogyne graminicola]